MVSKYQSCLQASYHVKVTRSAARESEKEGTKLYQKEWLWLCSVTICLYKLQKSCTAQKSQS